MVVGCGRDSRDARPSDEGCRNLLQSDAARMFHVKPLMKQLERELRAVSVAGNLPTYITDAQLDSKVKACFEMMAQPIVDVALALHPGVVVQTTSVQDPLPRSKHLQELLADERIEDPMQHLDKGVRTP